MENKMKDYLPKMEPAKMQALFEIRNAYKAGELSVEEARDRIRQRVGTVSAYHIAYLEQTMTEETEDECLREDIHSLIHLLDGFMDYSRPNLPANHPRPTGGIGKGLDLRQPGRGRKRTVRQQRESEGVQRIPGEDGGGFIEGAVRAGTATAQVVIVHRRQVVVNERVGVDGLNRAGGGINTIRRHAEIVCRCIKQRRAQPLAATKGCITHGVGKARARRRQDTAQGGFNARLITREGFGHEDECSKYKFGRDNITLISAVDDGVPDNMEARF